MWLQKPDPGTGRVQDSSAELRHRLLLLRLVAALQREAKAQDADAHAEPAGPAGPAEAALPLLARCVPCSLCLCDSCLHAGKRASSMHACLGAAVCHCTGLAALSMAADI